MLDWLLASDDDPGTAMPLAGVSLLQFTRGAMATHFEILLPEGGPRANAIADAAFDAIERVENLLTVYRPESPVAEMNRAAGVRPVYVEEELFRFLEECRSLNRQTRGAFDVACGSLIQAWGFHRRQGRIPTPAERVAALHHSGMRHVNANAEMQSIAYERANLALNFGAIGKGYALDRVVDRWQANREVGAGLIHGGYSSVRVVGSPPHDSRGWQIALKHPLQTEQVVATVWLRDQALGTSAATYQSFCYNGKTYGHIIDPRTGWPAEGLSQVTVIAPTATRADALSTAFFVAGEALIRDYCAVHPEIGVVYLPSGSDAPVLVGIPANRVE